MEVFAEVTGHGEGVEFLGLLHSYDLIDVFNSQNTGPHEESSE